MTAFTRNDFDTTTRTRGFASRTLTVLLLALAMVAATVFVPARATTGSDLESVRADVVGTFNYKIGLLSDKKAATDNPAKLEALQGGIDELVTLRDGEVATTDSVDRLWQLDEQAHAIYHETVAAAESAGMTEAEVLAQAKQKALDTIEYKIQLLRDWIAGCDDENAQRIVAAGIASLEALARELTDVTDPEVAYQIKDRAHQIYHATIDEAEEAKANADTKADEKTEEEKAAEALAAARRSTLSLIAHKVAILTVASETAKLPAVAEIFGVAADDVAAFEADARAARSVGALKEINAAVMDVYEQARAAAAAVLAGHDEGDDEGDDEGRDEDEAVTTIRERVAAVKTSTMVLVEQLAPTAEESPDTWDAVLDAKRAVYAAADAVAAAADTGRGLDDTWDDLEGAMRDFRRALIRHYVSVRSGPGFLAGFHIAG